MIQEITGEEYIAYLMRGDRMDERRDRTVFIEYDFDDRLVTLYDADHNGIGLYRLTAYREERLFKLKILLKWKDSTWAGAITSEHS